MLVTPSASTEHLRSSAEATALSVDPVYALRNATARKPSTILEETVLLSDRNRTADAISAAELVRNYIAVARLPHSYPEHGRGWLIVRRRRDLVRNLSKLGRYHPISTMKDQVA